MKLTFKFLGTRTNAIVIVLDITIYYFLYVIGNIQLLFSPQSHKNITGYFTMYLPLEKKIVFNHGILAISKPIYVTISNTKRFNTI